MRTHTFINLKTTTRDHTDDPFFYFKEAQKGGGYIFESHSGNITPYLEIAQNNDKLEVASSQFINYNTGGAKSMLHKLEKYSQALEEINNGQKGANSHWMWYIFPQLKIGQSDISNFFALSNLAEAEAYLKDSTLRENYLSITEALRTQINNGKTLEGILRKRNGNDIDVIKVISSLTLMRAAAESIIKKLISEQNTFIQYIEDLKNFIKNANAILHGREPCQDTLDRIKLEQVQRERFDDLQTGGEGAAPAGEATGAAAREWAKSPASPAPGAGRRRRRTTTSSLLTTSRAAADAAGARSPTVPEGIVKDKVKPLEESVRKEGTPVPTPDAHNKTKRQIEKDLRKAQEEARALTEGRTKLGFTQASSSANSETVSRTSSLEHGAVERAPAREPWAPDNTPTVEEREDTQNKGVKGSPTTADVSSDPSRASTPQAPLRNRFKNTGASEERDFWRSPSPESLQRLSPNQPDSTQLYATRTAGDAARTVNFDDASSPEEAGARAAGATGGGQQYTPGTTPPVSSQGSASPAGYASDPSRASTPQAPLRNRFKDATKAEERAAGARVARAAGATGDAARSILRTPSPKSPHRRSPDQSDTAQPHATGTVNRHHLSPRSPKGAQTPNNRRLFTGREAMAAVGQAIDLWGAASLAGGGQQYTPGTTPQAGRGSTDDRDPLSPISPPGTPAPHNRSTLTDRSARAAGATGATARRVSFENISPTEKDKSALNDLDEIRSYFQEKIEALERDIHELEEAYKNEKEALEAANIEKIKRLEEQYKTQQASTDSEGNIEDLKRQIEEVQKLHENTLSQKEVEFVTKISEQEDTIRALTTNMEVAQTKEATEKAALQEKITELKRKAAQPNQADPSNSPPPPSNEIDIDKNILEIAKAIGGVKYDKASNSFVPDTNTTPTGVLTYKTKYESAIFKLQYECTSPQYKALSERLIEDAINIAQCTPSNIDKEELEFFSKLLDPKRKTKTNNEVEISFKNNFQRIKNADLLATYLAKWNREDFNEYITKFSNKAAYEEWKDNKNEIKQLEQANSELKEKQANNNDKRKELGAGKANNNIGMLFSSFVGIASLITGITLAIVFQNPYLLLITSGTIISTIGYFACSSNYDKYQREDRNLNIENKKITDKIIKNSKEIKSLNNQLNGKQTIGPAKDTVVAGIGI